MNITAVLITIKDEVNVDDIPEVLQQERAIIQEYNAKGYMYDLLLRPNRNGALLLFKDLEAEKVQELISALPLFPYLKTVETWPFIK
jgi:muconolactone delta-isomerase